MIAAVTSNLFAPSDTRVAAMTMFTGGNAISAGVMLGAASMLSVGPNNIMMIREGLRRGRVMTVATAVLGSYVALLAAAFGFADSALGMDSGLRSVLSWMGLAALAYFALCAFKTASSARDRRDGPCDADESWTACLRRVMTVVWLNPLTYLELVLIPSALCGGFHTVGARLEFTGSLLAMAAVCCYGYAYGGGICGALLQHRSALRAFDIASGVLLTSVAAAMAIRLIGIV